jgi:hypothetical protein
MDTLSSAALHLDPATAVGIALLINAAVFVFALSWTWWRERRYPEPLGRVVSDGRRPR